MLNNYIEHWGIGGGVVKLLDCSWNILGAEEPIVFWWRVESETRPMADVCVDCGDPDQNQYLSTYMQYLTAISIVDLCQKMKQTYLTRPLLCWKIKSIRKFLKPLRTTDDAAVGEDGNPWMVYEEQIGWETIPECMEFKLSAGQSAGPIIVNQEQTVPNIFRKPVGYVAPTYSVPTTIAAVAPNVSGGIAVYLISGNANAFSNGFSNGFGTGGPGNAFSNGFSNGFGIGGLMFSLMEPWDRYLIDAEPEVLYLQPIIPPTDDGTVATSCACEELPQLLFMTHEFKKFSKLNYFLLKNSLTLPETITLSYGGSSQPYWQAVTHFSGRGLEDGTNEQWVLRYQWSCMNTIENTGIGDYTWEYLLAVSRTQRWLSTGVTKRTSAKLSADFLVDMTCQQGFGFYFEYHGDTGTVTDIISGESAVNLVVMDGIGLFDAATWSAGKTMEVKITEQVPNPSPPSVSVSIFH